MTNDSKNDIIRLRSTESTETDPALAATMKVKGKIKRKKPFVVRKPVFTTVKQISRYITVDGIVSEISRRRDEWPQVVLEELLTNAYDFLNTDYQPESFTKEDRTISAKVRIDSISDIETIKLLRITVRNSNLDKHEVFQNLLLIFDYDKWQSTKRNQYLSTGGALGDFLKRSLGMGYASWTFLQGVSNQWIEPLILRFNGQEYKIYLEIDTGINADARIEGPFSCHKSVDYIEVCVTLPILLSQCNYVNYELEQFFKTFRLGKRSTTTIDFVVENTTEEADSG